MGKRLLYGIIVLTLSVSFLSSVSKPKPVPNIILTILNNLENHYKWYPQQKTYIHTDKINYQADEKIWFKAYVVDAKKHTPDVLSTNLYIDLINPSGYVVQTKLLRLDRGIAKGDFSFSDTVPEGRYKIRAYTNWMRNTGSDFFFTRNIYLKNPHFNTYATRPQVQVLKKGRRKNKKLISRYDISFHPEGGDLIFGTTNKLAFKAINGLGYGVDFTGNILDKKGNIVKSINSTHLGMGAFNFTPEKNNKYLVEARFSTGEKARFPLPSMPEKAVGIQLNHIGEDSVYVKLISNLTPVDYPPNTLYYLIAHTRGMVISTAEIDLQDKDSPMVFPKNIFPEGICHFTLFNRNYAPVSERLMFVKKENPVQVQFSSSPNIPGKRQKVRTTITLKNPDNTPVKGNFSLSVSQKGSGSFENGNIFSNLQLTSDLKGSVENPSWYFENFSETKARHLDNLLLTQGWRRFSWNTVNLNKKIPVKYPVEQGIEITGRITREFFSLPLRDIKVTLSILNEYNDVYTTRSNLKGYFSFKNLSYPDTVSVKIEAVRHSGKKNLVIIANTKDPEHLTDFNYITESQIRKPGEIGKYVREKTPEEIEKENDPFYEENNTVYRIHQEPNTVIKVDETMQNYNNLAQIIQGRVPGVMVTGKDIVIRGINTLYGSTDPLFLVDGIPVDKTYAMEMNPYDIDRIEILKGPEGAIYGSRGANGVIAIYTKRGKFMIKGVLDFKMLGYCTASEFYSPRYDIKGRDEKFEDNRTTLLWVPELDFNSQGEATIEFYTSDIEEEFIIQIEGIDAKGHPVFNRSVIKVKE